MVRNGGGVGVAGLDGVDDRVVARGVHVLDRAGELVTSLDMAGCSLTVMWLDEELERLWTSPADTPAYRKGRRHLRRVVGCGAHGGGAQAR